MLQSADLTGMLARTIADKAKLQLHAFVDGKPCAYAARAVQMVGSDDEGFWVHLIDAPASATESLAQQRPQCHVTCCVNRTRYSFQTAVEGREPHLWINDQVMLDGLLLAAPTELKQLQERRSERFDVSDGSGVTAKLFRFAPWSLPGKKGRKAIQIQASLRDLSAHGAGFICTFDRQLNELRANEPVGCAIDFRNSKICLLATLSRVTEVSARTMQIGVQFCRPADQNPDSEEASCVRKVLEELERQQSLRQRLRRAS